MDNSKKPHDTSVTSKLHSHYCNIINTSQVVFSWIIQNRLGISKLLSFRLVSAQIKSVPHYSINSPEKGLNILKKICQSQDKNDYIFEKIAIPRKLNSSHLNAAICYPPNWQVNNTSECIIFNNQNGTTISQYINQHKLATTSVDDYSGLPTDTPGNYQSYRQSPVIMYDYNGTGINQDKGLLRYMPTANAETIANDGEDVLRYALNKFNKVIILGSSMGGYVANQSVAQYLEEISDKNEANAIASRIHIINHDSFSTTSRTVFPSLPKFADCVGRLLGAHADSILPISKLIHYPLVIDILAHKNDTVIPQGARMVDKINELISNATEQNKTPLAKIAVFESYFGEHACLSKDQIEHLMS